MTTDDRLSRYLAEQAEGIALAPADPSAVMRRGARRRARRRAGFAGGLAVAGVLAATLAVRDPGSDQQLEFRAGADVAASSYDWSTVEPANGLAYGDRTAQLDDGTIYGISTAPGRYDPEDWEAAQTPTLYRSTDGAEWAPVSLPGGVRTADLAGAGSTLFSLGTSPAGGLVLSSSTDGAGSWSSAELPADVAGLKARHGKRIGLLGAQVAALDHTHVLATTVAATNLDLTLYRPEIDPGTHGWTWDDAGVTVYELEKVDCGQEPAGVETRRAGDLAAGDALCTAAPNDPAAPPGTEVARYTYEELGIVGELRDHVGGRAYAFVTTDGQRFDQVELPVAGGHPDEALYAATPLASDDGYRIVLAQSSAASSTRILRSVDGVTWSESATLPGGPVGVGLVGGRPAIGMWDDQGRTTVRVELADGTWSDLDVAGAVIAPDGAETWVGPVAFGPLGVAAVVQSADADGRTVGQHLVHSADGQSLEVVSLDDLVDDPGSVTGMVVTADAIFARYTDAAVDDDPTTPPTQTVLVGTPTT